jgi:hypothetical protein
MTATSFKSHGTFTVRIGTAVFGLAGLLFHVMQAIAILEHPSEHGMNFDAVTFA